MMYTNLTIDDLMKYKHIAKAVEAVPQLSFKVLTTYRKTTPEDLQLFVNKHSELFAGYGKYRTKIVYSLLNAGYTNKVNLFKLVESEINELSSETMTDMIKSKEDGEKLAFALSILQDYLLFLRRGTWKGINSSYRFKEDFSEFVGLKDSLGISNLDLGSNQEILKRLDNEDFETLTSLSKDFLIYELLLAYEELNKRKV